LVVFSLFISPIFPFLLPLSVLFFFYQFPPPVLAPFPFPLSSCPTFIHDLNSLSRVQEVFFAGCGLNFYWEKGGKERHAAAAGRL
jgi:hypothetical protein